MKVSLSLTAEIEVPVFRNHYTCPDCGQTWTMDWPAQCDDTCPHCGARDITPDPESEDALVPAGEEPIDVPLEALQDEACALLDAFREAARPSDEYGITLYQVTEAN